MEELFTVTQLAEDLGVTPRAIRFYEARGLVAPRRAGTTRVFDRRDRARLMLVLRGKRLGFSLAEIREFLDLYDTDRTQRSQLSLLLGKVRRRVAELEQQHRDLEQTLDELREVERQVMAALADDPMAAPPQPERRKQATRGG
jgi:DNA-binding transcriptional MerR regulator